MKWSNYILQIAETVDGIIDSHLYPTECENVLLPFQIQIMGVPLNSRCWQRHDCIVNVSLWRFLIKYPAFWIWMQHAIINRLGYDALTATNANTIILIQTDLTGNEYSLGSDNI